MRGAILVGFLFAPGLFAQTVVDPASLATDLQEFDPQPGDRPLRCDVTPIEPMLDFSFRFQTGYSIRVPMEQYFGPDHAWAILTRVTPENGSPTYLAARVRLPDVPVTTVKLETFGGFLVGAGRYRIQWELFDDEGRICRKQWKIEAKLKHGEHNVQLEIPAKAVTDFAGAGLPAPPPRPAGEAPFRLTVLLHAGPLFPRRFHIRPVDRILLISTLSALVRQMQASTVRLAVFNLDRQKIVYSSENFEMKSMGDVAQALNQLEIDTIDVQTLQKPQGHIGLIESMIAKEAASPRPADAVVFLGPEPRYIDKLPASAFEALPEGMRFFYLQYRPFTVPRSPMLPDSISNAISTLKGRTIHIYSPGQFADALREVERLVGKH